MLKIIAPQDCDNAPKRRLIKDLNIAFANADVPALLPYFHEDIVWEMVNDRTISGIDNVAEFLRSMQHLKAKTLTIEYVITHGKLASANGIMDFGDKQIRFADFYEFTSAGAQKIKRIVSYAF